MRVSFWDYWVGQEDAEGIDYSLGVGAPNGIKAGIKTIYFAPLNSYGLADVVYFVLSDAFINAVVPSH